MRHNVLCLYLNMNNGLYLDKYRVHTARRPGQDYSQNGHYFVTICTQNRQPYFGRIQPATSGLTDAQLVGTALADRALECWQQVSQHFVFAEADAFVVMPDHIHGILAFQRPPDQPDYTAAKFGPQSHNLASVVRGFKVGVKAWATKSQLPFAWQSGYFDRVIRNEMELDKIRKYILDNPNAWDTNTDKDAGLFY